MELLNNRKQSIFILFFIGISISCFGQNCSSVSGKKNKEKNIETFTGLVTSNDFYSLLIQKQIRIKDSVIAPKYYLNLIAASRVLFSDSIINNPGIMEVKLIDGSTVRFENVSFSNNPLGSCCSLSFKVFLTEEQMKEIAIKPIVFIGCLGLATSFNSKKQKDQQKIILCLTTKY